MKATEEHLVYLDGLRESGETNMFGAGPYLMAEFGMSRRESHEVLSQWMKTRLTAAQKSALSSAMDILAEMEGPKVDEAWALLKQIVEGGRV